MLISIDHGNYAVKTNNFSFISGVTEHTVEPPMADNLMNYNGSYWTLSSKRMSYMRDKTRDERFFVLSLFAIAMELEKAGSTAATVTVDLAVGLPPEHYGVLKEKFQAYFQRGGIIKFTYNDKDYAIKIRNVMVFPQAYAAVVPQSSLIVNTSRIFVVDIGGYTTDVLLLRKGKPDLQYCRSLEDGIITMNNEIIRKVNALHDLTIDDEHIHAVLTGEKTILPNDVELTIKKEVKQHTQNILDQLRELQVDLRSIPAIFIGGGSLLLRKYIEASDSVVKADFVENPNANAEGYSILGNAKLKLSK